jgi:hypothetical protein
MPPNINRIRNCQDVSFDVTEIASTEVFDGTTTNMWFLDRQGNRVSGYVNSDCVFVEVLDPDQDEDQLRRERVDAYWDKRFGTTDVGQNIPFGPMGLNHFDCKIQTTQTHCVNALLGDSNIADTTAYSTTWPDDFTWAQLYV